MPIRFRCAYCNQLMGIARRKAGTVVRCPTCSGQVVVPDPGPADAAPHEPAPEGERGLFERSDFGEVFQNPTQPAKVSSGRGAARFPAMPPPGGSFDVEPIPLRDQRAPQPGIFLSPGKVTLFSVVVVLLLGAAFFVGLLVGKAH
jgi:DNA-directed RNA polymerase subunit RPC12/RpoP